MSKTLDDVRDEFYDLIGDIESGDITDLDTGWASIANAIKNLSYIDDISFDAPISLQSVLGVLDGAYPFLGLSDLMEKLAELEDMLGQKSHDSIEGDELTEAQELAVKCEKAFIEFIDKKLVSLVEK